MTPEQIATIFLGFAGVALQLIFKYVPKLSDWYQAQENKGLWMLGFVAITGIVLNLLACYVPQIKVPLACTPDIWYNYIQAMFIIGSSQQLTYLFTRKGSK